MGKKARKQPKVTAKQLVELLECRHSRDVFVSECKTGPTHGANHRRLDAWAMHRSWSKPHTFGYEIKVSRNDFLRDDKWTDYLGYCTNFYFVTCPGVCDVTEVPADAGLIVCSVNAARLYTKKKAPWRDTKIPEDLWRYILMCRTRVSEEWDHGEETGLDFWRGWLAEKDEKRDIGHQVARALREKYSTDVRKVETENHRLTKEIGNYKDLQAFLEREKLSIHGYFTEEKVRDRIENPVRLPRQFNLLVNDVERSAERLRDAVDKFEEAKG